MAEYQVAALLMAIYFKGMSPEETRALTRVMIESGETWKWACEAPVVDKHSTGGVGDKVSLILAPVVAACGAKVPMVSGRGLGHTGGTLDKLESIPGFRTDLSKSDFDRLLEDVGYGMGGQTESFAPLDKELYALRDVTGTVESIPLIIASILSKKVAEGIEALVLDVKSGDGAFMRERERAERLALGLVQVASEFGVVAEASITDMDEPLGRNVGHTLEVKESIAMLAGEPVDPRLASVVKSLSGRLLVLAGTSCDEEDARGRIDAVLEQGSALERFRDNVEAQGGDPKIVEDPDRLGEAPVRWRIEARRDAWLAALPARAVGMALVDLGGGRRVKGDPIDRTVGFELPFSVGDRVSRGEVWAVVHAASEEAARAAAEELESVAEWSEEPVESGSVVIARVTGDTR